MVRTINVTSVIFTDMYPIVEAALNKNSNKFKNMMTGFFKKNSEKIHDVAPYDNINFSASDEAAIFTSLGLDKNKLLAISKTVFYYDIPHDPQAAKETYIQVLMCAVRYYLKKNKLKEAQLTTLFLCFSGKIYASLFYGQFQKVYPKKYKAVMDYVVNNMLTNKSYVKEQGSVFGAMVLIANTWVNTYSKQLTAKDTDDDEVSKLIQQLRNRVKSFLKKISNAYYKAYENKNYLNFESDKVDSDSDFRLTQNNTLVATKYTEMSITFLTTENVSMKICTQCADENIRAIELKGIMEAILLDKQNLADIRRVVNIIICDFIKNYPNKPVGGVDFIAHTIKAKPNVKDGYVLEMRKIILSLLDENSPNYRRRKSRHSTAISYYYCVMKYLAFAISSAVNR